MKVAQGNLSFDRITRVSTVIHKVQVAIKNGHNEDKPKQKCMKNEEKKSLFTHFLAYFNFQTCTTFTYDNCRNCLNRNSNSTFQDFHMQMGRLRRDVACTSTPLSAYTRSILPFLCDHLE